MTTYRLRFANIGSKPNALSGSKDLVAAVFATHGEFVDFYDYINGAIVYRVRAEYVADVELVPEGSS
jgi:hypothetical protein